MKKIDIEKAKEINAIRANIENLLLPFLENERLEGRKATNREKAWLIRYSDYLSFGIALAIDNELKRK